MRAAYQSLRQWRPTTHDYTGQAIEIYDDTLLLVDASQFRVGDIVLIGSRKAPKRFRVRHVEYHPGQMSYWRVRIEPLARPSELGPTEAAS